MEASDGEDITKLIGNVYIDVSNIILDLHAKRCLNCKNVDEILESCLGILHILARHEHLSDVLLHLPHFLRTLAIQEPVGVGKGPNLQ